MPVAAALTAIEAHAIRHRAATDIANSGVPLRVGMALTAHKTVSQFMRYVHIEDHAVRDAAELVSSRRAAALQSWAADNSWSPAPARPRRS